MTIRLPDFLRYKIELIAIKYEMSINDIVKTCIVNGIGTYDLSDSKMPELKLNVTATAEKGESQSDSKTTEKQAVLTADEDEDEFEKLLNQKKPKIQSDSKKPQKQPKVTASLVRDNIIYYKIYNNNNIYVQNPKIEEAWLEYVQMRKEIGKTIRQTSMKLIWKKLEPYLENESVQEIIEAFNVATERQYLSVYFKGDPVPAKQQSNYGEDDL